MSDSELFYKHSGRFDPAGVAWSLVAMAATGLAAGFLYGALVWVVPFIYLVVLGTIGLGLVIGFVSTHLSVKAKTRNNPLIVFGPAFASLAALYAAWVGYLFAASDWQYLFWNPLEIASTAQRISETGMWSMFGNTPTGMMLYGIWLIEAGIIVGIASFMGLAGINDRPYNENADAWCDQYEALPPAKALSPDTISQIRQQLVAGDLSCFGLFEPMDEDAATFTAFNVCWAPGFEHEQFLSITSITLTQDEKGDIQTQSTPIAINMIIDPEARAVIDDILTPSEHDASPQDDLDLGEAADTPSED